MNPKSSLVARVESYLRGYCAFPDPRLSLVLAIWTLGTWCFDWFDAYPYLVVTAATKRAGKSRLAELLGFLSFNPKPFAAMTPAVMFRCIGDGATVIFDEAETLSSESAGVMRSVLNVGYRRGQTIPRMQKEQVVEFNVYCPKVFVLIGDVYDTLKDRSIIAELTRGVPAKKFVYADADAEGRTLGDEMKAAVKALDPLSGDDVEFLPGRESEIWSPLFALCATFCPDRLDDLTRTAADFAAMKTADTKRYTALANAEESTRDDAFALAALLDLARLFAEKGSGVAVSTDEAVTRMKNLSTAPWRTYRGDGLTPILLAQLLSRFGIRPKSIKLNHKTNLVKRGYRRDDVTAAAAKHAKK
jgi:hypothetical protein